MRAGKVNQGLLCADDTSFYLPPCHAYATGLRSTPRTPTQNGCLPKGLFTCKSTCEHAPKIVRCCAKRPRVRHFNPPRVMCKCRMVAFRTVALCTVALRSVCVHRRGSVSRLRSLFSYRTALQLLCWSRGTRVFLSLSFSLSLSQHVGGVVRCVSRTGTSCCCQVSSSS